ncbi:MAG: hypothetical protein KJN90_13405 [Gammaproteobacteria bacterium]|nr:hypothetical protein [Gammaproteobacteria bacterium]
MDTKSYTEYCTQHLSEFRHAVQEEASIALASWPARTAAVLMVISSIVTYADASGRGNPYADLTLFAYLVPVGLVATYPLISLLISDFQKYGPILIDLLCVTGLSGLFLSLFIVLRGAGSAEDLDNLYLNLQGQTAFVLAICSAFGYHTNYLKTFFRNTLFLVATAIVMYLLGTEFLVNNRLTVLEGYFLGVIASWVFYDGVRTRFYLKSTDADMRQHLYNQFSKLVYPHQLERIKLGDELESTMPLKEGKAIINVFDVQKSSEIRHERTREFFMGVFQSFLQICMEGYEHNPLRSRAFRLKETGDGFISAVGYPFLPIESRSLADSAVETALEMFRAFNEEVEKFNYSRPIKGAMGLAYNSVQGTFQSGGIRAYDLFGDSLIQAARYEELRKHPVLSKIIKAHAESLGFEHYHILVVQEVIYNSLSEAFRNLFIEVDLWGDEFEGYSFHSLHDNDARYVYFHVLD